MGSKNMRNVVVGVLIGIVTLWAATLPLLLWLVPDQPAGNVIATSSQLGDAFGVVNALFSGLALAGVVVAILLQREELRLQRKELEETREELRRQADASEKQSKALDALRVATLLGSSLAASQAIYALQLETVHNGRTKRQQEDAKERLAVVERINAQIAGELGTGIPAPNAS